MESRWDKWHNKWNNMSQQEKADIIISPIYLIIAIITFFTFPWADSLMHPTCVGSWLFFFVIKVIGSLLWPIIWFCNVMTWKI